MAQRKLVEGVFDGKTLDGTEDTACGGSGRALHVRVRVRNLWFCPAQCRMQQPVVTVECFDAKTGAAVGSQKFLLHEDGRISVPALKERFRASWLALDTPDGILIESTAGGHSNLSFAHGVTAKLYRWPDRDEVQFGWNFWKFHKAAQGNNVSHVETKPTTVLGVFASLAVLCSNMLQEVTRSMTMCSNMLQELTRSVTEHRGTCVSQVRRTMQAIFFAIVAVGWWFVDKYTLQCLLVGWAAWQPAPGQARCEVVNVGCSIKFGVRCSSW
jgi:hypothetical protein